MPVKILLTTTSYQDTPGSHQDLLESQGWEVVRERGPLSEQQMLELAGDFDGFICGDDAITKAVIDKSLPKLKWISKYGIGIDKIDKEYATSKGLPIGFCPGVNHTTVAEHTFGLLIGLTKKIAEVSRHTREGDWKRLTGNEILGKRIGIIGMGRIGKAVIERAGAFGLEVCAFDVYWDADFAKQHNVERCETMEALLESCDIVSLHCFLDESTDNLINASTIEKMKDGVIILNCARGEIVNPTDIAAALNSGKVGGYGADVLDIEPPPADHVLFQTPNTIITSHIGSRTYESVQRQATMATENAICFVAGNPPLAQANQLPGQDSAAKAPAKAKSDADVFYVVDTATHNSLVEAAYVHRGYSETESKAASRFCEMASTYGIRTHNALKALHLDHLFGSATGGCVPGAEVEKKESRFEACEIWDGKLKLGQSVAFDAMQRCMELADKYGVGQVSVDNTFHYLWGGGYVMDAALKGYIAYSNCTSTLAEVVPYFGKFPTLGTNPHSWAFPTQDAVGFPVVIDWATSTVAMGRVQQFKREGKQLPEGAAVDAEGNPTTDPNKAVSLLPFGLHKGYGLSLINEIVGALIGGSLPTIRGRAKQAAAANEKSSTNFYFQVIHPDAMSGGLFAKGRSQSQNVAAVLEDIRGHGNEGCLLPGQIEANAAKQIKAAGGLLFSEAEIRSFNEIAQECGQPEWDINSLKTFSE